MKKVLAVLLTLVFITSLAACAAETPTNHTDAPDTITESYMGSEAVEDTANDQKDDETSSVSNLSDKAELYVKATLGDSFSYYKRSQNENYLFNWDIEKGDKKISSVSLDITIDGNIRIQSGTKYSEVKENSYSLRSQSEEDEIDPGYMGNFTLSNQSSGKEFGAEIANTSDEVKPAKECEIFGVRFENMEKSPDFDYKGIKKGEEMSDAIRKAGLPNNYISIIEKDNNATLVLNYYDSDSSKSLTMKFDYNESENLATLTYLSVIR